MKCSIVSGSISSERTVFFSPTLHHGVSRAEFSLAEPNPLQAAYVDHSRNPRSLGPPFRQILRHAEGYVWPIQFPEPAQQTN